MNIFVCGVNHKTADIAFRERLYIANENLEEPLHRVVLTERIHEAMILSTCNRTELYCAAQEIEAVKECVQHYYHLSDEEFKQHVYCYQGTDALEHIICVAAGIDSMILGEPQIFGQMKEAFNLAHHYGTIGPELSQFFQFAFSATKKIRTETVIGQHPVSIASASVSLAKCIYSNLSELQVLLIGAGDTALLAAEHFFEHGVRKISVANRTLDKAQILANQFSGYGILLSDLPTYLSEFDIILTATASSEWVLTKQMVEKTLGAGRKRPLFIIDIALPRDVEESVGTLNGVYLYNIDDLKQLTEEGLGKRTKAAVEAVKLIKSDVFRYMKRLQAAGQNATIRAYRNKVEQVKAIELAKALKALQSGQDAEKVLLTMARSLTNKLMHHPSILLRTAASDNNKAFLDVAKQLFELEE